MSEAVPPGSGVRASIWSNDFIVGAGAPGGVSEPWEKIDIVPKIKKAHASAPERGIFMSNVESYMLYQPWV